MKTHPMVSELKFKWTCGKFLWEPAVTCSMCAFNGHWKPYQFFLCASLCCFISV